MNIKLNFKLSNITVSVLLLIFTVAALPAFSNEAFAQQNNISAESQAQNFRLRKARINEQLKSVLLKIQTRIRGIFERQGFKPYEKEDVPAAPSVPAAPVVPAPEPVENAPIAIERTLIPPPLPTTTTIPAPRPIIPAVPVITETTQPAPVEVEEVEEQPNLSVAEARETTCDASEEELIAATKILINNFRGSSQTCDGVDLPAVGLLTSNDILNETALSHSDNMAIQNFFSHEDQNGDRVADRTTDAGYVWRSIGENIAAGFSSLGQVFDGWEDSPSHCRNMMKESFTEFGIACVERSSVSSDFKNYWTINLGRALN